MRIKQFPSKRRAFPHQLSLHFNSMTMKMVSTYMHLSLNTYSNKYPGWNQLQGIPRRQTNVCRQFRLLPRENAEIGNCEHSNKRHLPFESVCKSTPRSSRQTNVVCIETVFEENISKPCQKFVNLLEFRGIRHTISAPKLYSI